MGLRSFSGLTGGVTFGKGMTSALFQRVGTYPSLNEALNIEAIGRAKIPAKSWYIQFSIAPGPTDFEALLIMSFFSTSLTETMNL